MNFIFSYLKSPKLIAAALGVAVLFSSVWYGLTLIQENARLEEQLTETRIRLDASERTLEQERERFGQTIDAYDRLMSSYMDSIYASEERSRELQRTISRLSSVDEELQQCLQYRVPDELLDQLFR